MSMAVETAEDIAQPALQVCYVFMHVTWSRGQAPSGPSVVAMASTWDGGLRFSAGLGISGRDGDAGDGTCSVAGVAGVAGEGC